MSVCPKTLSCILALFQQIYLQFYSTFIHEYCIFWLFSVDTLQVLMFVCIVQPFQCFAFMDVIIIVLMKVKLLLTRGRGLARSASDRRLEGYESDPRLNTASYLKTLKIDNNRQSRGNVLAQKRSNSLPWLAMTSRKRSCNQRAICLLGVIYIKTQGVWERKGDNWHPWVILGDWTWRFRITNISLTIMW